MSVRLLNATDGFGLFGKLPGAGDFLRLNIGSAATKLDAWLERGFAQLEAEDPAWRDDFAHAPVWRLALDAGVAGGQALAGVMAPSRDASARAFPCLALLPTLDVTPATIAGAPGWFEAVEAALRSAAGGELATAALRARLEALGPVPHPGAQDFMVKSRTTPDATYVDVEGGPVAASEAVAAALEVASPAPGSSLWWRHEGGRTRLVTAIGLPRGAAFATLFQTPALPALPALPAARAAAAS